MNELRIQNTLTRKQIEWFKINTKYIVGAAGRRFGKGEFAVRWQVIKNALVNETKEDNPHAWASPTFRQTKLGFYKTLKFLKRHKIPYKENLSDLYVDLFPTEGKEFFSRIQYFSLDRPQLVEGFAFMSLVIDEAGILLKNDSVWYNSIAPTTMDHDCPVLFIGTPKGRNLYHTFYLRGLDALLPEWTSVTASSYDNTIENGGMLSKEVIDGIASQMPEDARKQEIFAEFIDSAGLVFRKARECATGKFQKRNPKKHYVAGLDLAKVHDFTVLTIGTTEGEVHHIERINQLDWTIQKKIIYNKCKEYQARVLVDSTGVGEPIYEDLLNSGLDIEGYHFTHSSKRDLINGLIVSTENEILSYPPYEQLLSELEAYEYQISPSGNVKTNAPEGEGYFDDCVISLALYNHLVSGKTFDVDKDIIFGSERETVSGW